MRFEFESGRSHKFWEISVQGVIVTVRFGRLNTKGQERTKTHPTALAAKRAADALINEKLGKGYRRVEGTTPRTGVRRPRAAKLKPMPRGYEHLEVLRRREIAFWDRIGAELRADRERIGKLPRKLERKLDWDELESSVGRRARTRKSIKRSVKPLPGLQVTPPSYAEFLGRFLGTGEWDLVYQKRGWPLHFNWLGRERMPKVQKLLRTTYAAEAPRLAARSRTLVAFAQDGSSKYFCWDASTTDAKGEPAVDTIDQEPDKAGRFKILRLGKNLLEVLQHYRPRGVVG
jgi:predicted DNA-binding WGR domain protein